MNSLSNLTLYVTFFVSLYFEVFILINFLENKSEIKKGKKYSKNLSPSVTIIVPVFNEEKTVTKTVSSLLNLDYPKDKLKIFIVNDGSTDSTPQIIENFKNYKNVEILHKDNGGKHTALNMAILKSNSDFIGCLDADSFVMPDTLNKIIPHFEDEKIMAVTPAIKIHEPDKFIKHVQSNEYNLGIFMKRIFGSLDSITVTPGPFSIFRRQVFDNLGLFKSAYNTEDLEIAMRMQKNHYKIANANDAVVYTVGPDSIKKLFKQRVRWIHGFLSNSIDYRSMFLKPSYGNLGLFILPMAIVTILLFFASVGLTLINFTTAIKEKIFEIKTVGFNWALPQFHFDWFFISTDSKIFLGLILFVTTILFIQFGKNISEENNKKISIHTIYFPFIYSFFSFFWLSKAIYTALISKKTTWR